MGSKLPRKLDLRNVVPTTDAKWDTFCPSCSNPIYTGDKIYLLDLEDGDEIEEWCCKSCAMKKGVMGEAEAVIETLKGLGGNNEQ